MEVGKRTGVACEFGGAPAARASTAPGAGTILLSESGKSSVARTGSDTLIETATRAATPEKEEVKRDLTPLIYLCGPLRLFAGSIEQRRRTSSSKGARVKE